MKEKINAHSSITLSCKNMFHFAVSYYVIYPLILHNMSTIELLTELLFRIHGPLSVNLSFLQSMVSGQNVTPIDH